ncbi:MAG: sulfite exporter TauE/SafE family protein [Alphaproteobacteria bacterium]|nr:sulfite exporter TauE/SafE family protein [Alphaproteobacteria bacterium]
MEAGFLGMPGVDLWIFIGLAAASFVTTLWGVTTGAAGGLLLLAIMALVFPPIVLVPMHTLVQLGGNVGRIILMRSYIMTTVLWPFLIGSVIGGVAGAQIFVSLPAGLLQGIIACFILFALWLPKVGSFGPERGRFAFIGFLATFLGVFVSATGTLVTPFMAAASPDRRNYVATFGAVMTIVHAAKVLAFALAGVAMAAYAPLIIAMISTTVVATMIGRRLLDRVPEKLFRLILKVILTLLALRLFWVALSESGWI